MALPPTNPRIEELQARLKADPKSRHFYPLGEELRKVGRTSEAEEILRTGLAANPTYLSAWVSLGRTLKELGRYQEATDALGRALVIDPGNVVAARLAGDSFLAMGDKVEAIKKFKLARAMLPSDEALEEQIDRLDRELNPATAEAESPVWEHTAEAVLPAMPSEPATGVRFAESVEAAEARAPVAAEPEASPFTDSEESPFEVTPTVEMPVGDPVHEAEGESPFESIGNSEEVEEEPATPFFDRFTDESGSPPAVSSPFEESPMDAAADHSPNGEGAAVAAQAFASGDELIATSTMADLYARQGHFDSARRIYERILERDPSNGEVRTKLGLLPESGVLAAGDRNETAIRLEGWLRKVARRADGNL
jgi:pentatricopeptide repeat protein